MVPEAIAALAAAIWLYLVFARGGFWLCSERDDGRTRRPAIAPAAGRPSVAVVIPARDEADGIAETIGSLLRQDYPGALRSCWSTTTAATAPPRSRAGAPAQRTRRSAWTIVAGQPLPPGWTGKLWAVKQGVDATQSAANPPDYLLLTDADIVYAPDALRGWWRAREANELVLTSLMVKLRCESLAERSLIPAFVFFFQMLYPFAWVNRPAQRDRGRGRRLHAGARAMRCEAAGGIDAIRDALIDDCALGALLKAQGPIWLGLTERVRSIRPYPDCRRHPPHGVALGLCAAALFAAAARRHGRRHGADLSRAAAAGAVRQRPGAAGSGSLAWVADGARLPADAALLPALAAVGPGAARHRAASTCCSPLDSAYAACARPRRHVEGPRPGERVADDDATMPAAAALRQGRTGTRISRSRRG